MLKLLKISFTDSEVESVSSWVELLFTHQDKNTEAIVSFHVSFDMTREEFESKTVNSLIEDSKPLITAKLERISV